MKIPEHTSFLQPDNPMQKIWRYLSLAKFLDFYLTNELYFSRVDLLEDKCEGTYSKLTTGMNFDKVSIPSGLILTREEYTKRIRQSIHVNCWRLDDFESEAMWKIYCGKNDGLVIQTTYQKLADSLPEGQNLYIGKIKYIDYETEHLNRGNIYNPVMHKRKAFNYENEVRILKSGLTFMNDHNLPLPESGMRVTTNLIENIETISINPYAEEWYYQTIIKLFQRLEISTTLKWSEIKSTIYH